MMWVLDGVNWDNWEDQASQLFPSDQQLRSAAFRQRVYTLDSHALDSLTLPKKTQAGVVTPDGSIKASDS